MTVQAFGSSHTGGSWSTAAFLMKSVERAVPGARGEAAASLRSPVTGAAPAPEPAANPAPMSSEERFVAGRFSALLNMASPKGHVPGMRLISPALTLALHGTGGNGQNTTFDVTHKGRANSGPLDLSPEGMAQEMIDVIGNGEVITLADAQRALHLPRAGTLTNSRETISAYFRGVDSDRSGSLDRQELVKLMTYYRDHQDDDPYDAPRLPATWA